MPTAELTIPGGHDHTVAPIFRVCVTQQLHLGRPPRLSLRLVPLTAPLRRCFVLYTFSKGADILPIRTDNVCPNHSYCAACHCSTTCDVALDAFNSTYLVRLAKFRASVVRDCILNNYRGFASPSVYPCSMCRVADANCLRNLHCNRYRGTRL